MRTSLHAPSGRLAQRDTVGAVSGAKPNHSECCHSRCYILPCITREPLCATPSLLDRKARGCCLKLGLEGYNYSDSHRIAHSPFSSRRQIRQTPLSRFGVRRDKEPSGATHHETELFPLPPSPFVGDSQSAWATPRASAWNDGDLSVFRVRLRLRAHCERQKRS